MDRLIRLLAALLAVGVLAVPQARAASAPRIVSLAPHITELLFAAGAGERLVGVSAYSDYPPAAKQLPRIGDAFRLDYERILALHPDLAVAWASGTPQPVIARLRALGVPVTVLGIRTLEDIPAAIEQLGRLAGTGKAADAAAARFRERLDAMRADYAGRPPVTVFIELDQQPLFTVTGRHMISEVVSICGGRNVFASLPGLAPPVDLEAVVAADPEAILYTGPDPDPARFWHGRNEIRAVRDGNVLKVPGDFVSRATPRVLLGVKRVCQALDAVRERERAQQER